MRLNEFDEKERLTKANEKLKHYKTAAGADATAADAAGNFARGNRRFKGINAATNKQFDNDAKLAKLKEQGVAEGQKRKKKKTSSSLGRYFFPGYGYYGSGESGEGGGDGGGGESVDPGVEESNHWYDAGKQDAEEGKRPNPHTRLKTMQDKQARHPEEVYHYMNGYKSVKLGVAEDDDAVAAFLARGGEIQQLKPQRGPKRSGVGFASKHIGSGSGRGNTKGKVSGLGANTGKSGKPVVTAEQGVAEGSEQEVDERASDLKKFGYKKNRFKSLDKLNNPLGEDSLAAMRRLAGVTTPAPVVPNGQRQYRHMPTAVQPR